ncbi:MULTISPECIES: magnesium transporter [Ectothiorhodospira]|uniref:magnesium transporter n=1 Tax=Ectothiorhodospira TaxID=1051 RepID=UPI00047EB2AD|nr:MULTISPECIES: magnesium transporter [Ectothiorhodospira]MCG5493370.1 magnesium transporter [Ectothiorhodospira variabilis]MCG5502699.1 magnesium transporter [Ectothiorhodospira variabilis]MCG5505535.1 magnesium transporter [Ectothiorhodospira variabilis]
MEFLHERDLEQVRECLDAGDLPGVRERLDEMRIQDIAHVLMDLEPDPRRDVFRLLPPGRRVDVFSYLDPHHQLQLINQVSVDEGRYLLSEMLPDDLTALLEDLDKDQVRKLLRLLPFRSIRRALSLLGYPADSCGRLMTTAVVSVRPEWTMARALDHLRVQAGRGETVNLVYVTDDEGVLEGVLALKHFLKQQTQTLVSELMTRSVISIDAHQPQEEALHIMRHYDLPALPVVDEDSELLGIITVDDVLDVEEEETTEDFQKMGSVGALNLSLRDARPWLLYRKRVGWLLILVGLNIVGGFIIAGYEEAIEALVLLVFFLPLVIAGGGNAGAQSSTLMVRSLATGDARPGDWLRLWGRELAVAGALGLTMGVTVSMLGLWRGGPEVALMLSLAMLLIVMVGSMVGMILPFILSRLRLDPATASAPLVTSIADVAGILIYFGLAAAMLGLPR